MKKIVKIEAMSLAKLMGIMYAIMGLIIGGLVTLFAGLGGVLVSGDSSGFSFLFGIGAIIILPIFYGVFGFIFGLLSGSLFNLAVKWAGGLNIEIEDANPAGQAVIKQ